MIDLHTHSNFSDGELSPIDLVDYAHNKGISTIALTDHDTVGGVALAKSRAVERGMNFITGIELSVNWGSKAIHVVGLGIDINASVLIQVIDKQKQTRHDRSLKMSDKLMAVGVENPYEHACAFTKHKLVTRPHFAKVLIEQGFAKDIKTAFKKYLKRGAVAYAKAQWVDLEEAVQTIHQAGGIAVIAHPMRYRLTQTKLRELLDDFVYIGGKAIEVIAGYGNKDEIYQLSALCQKYDLLASVGSDFHSEKMTPHAMSKLKHIPSACRSIIDELV